MIVFPVYDTDMYLMQVNVQTHKTHHKYTQKLAKYKN